MLDPNRRIALRLDPKYSNSYESQIGLIVAASLLSRMTPNLVIDTPSTPLHNSVPWQCEDLKAVLSERVCLDRPDQQYLFRRVKDDDYQLNIGPEGGPVNVHGSGWMGFVGPSPSPLPSRELINPIGPALASVVAVSRLFDRTPKFIQSDIVLDGFNWQVNPDSIMQNPYIQQPDVGNIWCIGLGSVGTSALFFLSLATRGFKPTLIDMDVVKVENLDRSPIFRVEHTTGTNEKSLHKVAATEDFLRSLGVDGISAEPCSFASSPSRKKRIPRPDILVSAANEQNVRHTIEQSLPPIQIYATTGNEWQSTLLRHIPMVDSCSCCVFPPLEQVANTMCSFVEMDVAEIGDKVDAALPFLSFMAGLMTAAEILKLGIPGYPFSNHNKITFRAPSPRKVDPDFFAQSFPRRNDCVCQTRHQDIHLEVISSSKYATLSGSDSGLQTR